MYLPVRNIVNNLQKFHSELAKFYSSLAERTENGKVRSLLKYLEKSERYQEGYICYYIKHTPAHILNQSINYMPRTTNNLIFDCKIGSGIEMPATVSDVMKIALTYDVCLINFCDTLAKEGDNPVAKELFCKFCKVTKREEGNLFTYSSLMAS